MAFYVLILKESEDPDTVTYRFGPSESEMGRLRINKLDGRVEELEAPPGDPAMASHIFQRATWRLLKHFATGEFPDRTVWAS